jgi:hypothetical protein
MRQNGGFLGHELGEHLDGQLHQHGRAALIQSLHAKLHKPAPQHSVLHKIKKDNKKNTKETNETFQGSP